MKNRSNIRKMVFLSLLVTISLVIYIIEGQIPVLFPGVKLGLANSVSLVALLLFGWREALLILILRITLGSFLGGNMASFWFSLSGGLLSNIVMILVYKYFKKSLSVPSISLCGAVFHNIGQLLVAAFIIQDLRIYIYLPVLLTSAVVTGYFIGLCTSFLQKRLEKISVFDELRS